MIDYLFNTITPAKMIAAIGSYNPDGRGPMYNATSVPQWRSDISFPCSVTDYTNPASPTQVPGFWLWVGLPKQDSNLTGNAACILVADRGLALSGNPNYLIQSSMTPAQRAARMISPVVAGAHYPFVGSH
jgi:hypothetical protein